ncbi:MAG: hypothetical protein V4857_16515 [Pseudomonadota bacterium]
MICAPTCRPARSTQVATASAAYRRRKRFVEPVLDGAAAPDLERIRPAALLCESFARDRCAGQAGRAPVLRPRAPGERGRGTGRRGDVRTPRAPSGAPRGAAAR